jgi:hypothetical protein
MITWSASGGGGTSLSSFSASVALAGLARVDEVLDARA